MTLNVEGNLVACQRHQLGLIANRILLAHQRLGFAIKALSAAGLDEIESLAVLHGPVSILQDLRIELDKIGRALPAIVHEKQFKVVLRERVVVDAGDDIDPFGGNQ